VSGGGPGFGPASPAAMVRQRPCRACVAEAGLEWFRLQAISDGRGRFGLRSAPEARQGLGASIGSDGKASAVLSLRGRARAWFRHGSEPSATVRRLLDPDPVPEAGPISGGLQPAATAKRLIHPGFRGRGRAAFRAGFNRQRRRGQAILSGVHRRGRAWLWAGYKPAATVRPLVGPGRPCGFPSRCPVGVRWSSHPQRRWGTNRPDVGRWRGCGRIHQPPGPAGSPAGPSHPRVRLGRQPHPEVRQRRGPRPRVGPRKQPNPRVRPQTPSSPRHLLPQFSCRSPLSGFPCRAAVIAQCSAMRGPGAAAFGVWSWAVAPPSSALVYGLGPVVVVVCLVSEARSHTPVRAARPVTPRHARPSRASVGGSGTKGEPSERDHRSRRGHLGIGAAKEYPARGLCLSLLTTGLCSAYANSVSLYVLQLSTSQAPSASPKS
jgi:hypothetical protein